MVRKSILVYDLLRSEQPPDGFTEKEIVEQISAKHDILAGKALRKQVAVALRRGVDFGIIAKKNNRFRFDLDNAKLSTARRETSSRRNRSRGKNKVRSVKRRTKSRQRPNNTRSKSRNQKRPIPSPNLPKSWTPNKRNLAEEPLSKVKKI